jgi:hypothetical protein
MNFHWRSLVELKSNNAGESAGIVDVSGFHAIELNLDVTANACDLIGVPISYTNDALRLRPSVR